MKKSITCKGITIKKIKTNINETYTPKAGDLAVFKVISIGKHDSIQSESGHNCYLFEGDEFAAAFGNRYATEQFEGYVPEKPTLDLEILGKGGVVGIVHSMHYTLKDIGSTKVQLIGYVVDEEDKVINTIYYNREKVKFDVNAKPKNAEIILSLGSSMDSGKTTTAGYVSRSLSNLGKKVAFIKLTGTSFTKDRQFVSDCGASTSLDFSAAGYPSTYLLDLEELCDLYQYLLNKLKDGQFEYIVIEIADGILQRETEMMLNDAAFRSTIDHVIFSAVDSLSALTGIDRLSAIDLRPFAVAGLFTASPLLHKEVEARTNLPVLTLKDVETKDLTELMHQSVMARS